MNAPTKKLASSVKPRTSSLLPTDSAVDLVNRNLPKAKPVSGKAGKEFLKDQWTTLSQRAMNWIMEGDRLERMMEETKLRDITIMLGIATEKVLLLEGQPTEIISHQQHQDLDKVGLALKDALEKRGLVTFTERKVHIQPNEPGDTLEATPIITVSDSATK